MESGEGIESINFCRSFENEVRFGVESGEGIERSSRLITPIIKNVYLWNPVKELKVSSTRAVLMLSALWNPVKELKGQLQRDNTLLMETSGIR